MFYSKTTGGFYDAAIHGNAIPVDAIEITMEEYAALFDEQSSGKKIIANEHGHPIAIDHPQPTPPTRSEIEVLRLLAYADPINGSDRYFSEAAEMEAAGESGADEIRSMGLSRRAEIQAEYPWPT